MKFSTLSFMYVLVFGLIIYSCTKDESIKPSAETVGYELMSPDGYMLADSPEGLHAFMKDAFVETFGEDYQFEILDIKYLVLEKLTNAEVIYQTADGDTRNVMFNWLHPDGEQSANERLLLAANMIPWCSGPCPQGAPQATCSTYLDINTLEYSCYCGQIGGTGGCIMNFGAMNLPNDGLQLQNSVGIANSTAAWTAVTSQQPVLQFQCVEQCEVQGYGTVDCGLNYRINGILTCKCNGQNATECKSPVPVQNQNGNGSGDKAGKLILGEG